jgi:hypothetical protein
VKADIYQIFTLVFGGGLMVVVQFPDHDAMIHYLREQYFAKIKIEGMEEVFYSIAETFSGRSLEPHQIREEYDALRDRCTLDGYLERWLSAYVLQSLIKFKASL